MTAYTEIRKSEASRTDEMGARTDHNNDIVAWALVAIYTVLTAGRIIVPNIFASVWMIPTLVPTVFLLVHGARAYGIRTALGFGALVLVVSNFFENLSIATGFPFGNYHYSNFAGPMLFNVPLLIGPAYVGMGYLSWTVARLLLGKTRGALTGASVIGVPIVAGFLMVAWDLTFDPVASTVNGFWIWAQGGSYFGVPVSNFLGWFLTVFVFFTLFAYYVSRRAQPAADSPRLSGQYWLQAVVLYVAAAIPALLGPLTNSVVGPVPDPSGTVWRATDLYLTVALAAVFTMVPVAVLAALKAVAISPVEAPHSYDAVQQSAA
jgi:putative membrane protein